MPRIAILSLSPMLLALATGGTLTAADDVLVDRNLILQGSNAWILHSPDDGRNSLYLAHRTGSEWDWNNGFWFENGTFKTTNVVSNSGTISGFSALSINSGVSLDPGKNDHAAITLNGAYGGGLTLRDCGKSWTTWAQDLGATYRIGYGRNNQGTTGLLTLQDSGTVTVNGSLVTSASMDIAGDLRLEGSNAWILHSPDDGRNSLHLAHRTGSGWDWNNGFEFENGTFKTTNIISNSGTVSGVAALSVNSGTSLDPGKNDHTAVTLNGAYGGGLTLRDGGKSWTTWTQDLGATYRIGYGRNDQGATGLLTLQDSGTVTVNGSLVTNASMDIAGDLRLGGNNSWILHSPDDGRNALYLAPQDDKGNWNWGNGFSFDKGTFSANGITIAGSATISNEAKVGNLTVSGTAVINTQLKAADIQTGHLLVTGVWWGDSVFADDYRLAPLSEVKAFVAEHRHLPGIPSEAAIKQDGIAVDDMLARQMVKIEELTLHAIGQEETIERLRTERDEDRARIARLELLVGKLAGAQP